MEKESSIFSLLELKTQLIIFSKYDLSLQVTELSRPSSVEVEDIIQQLVQNILRRFFLDDASPDFMEQSVGRSLDNHPDGYDELCDTVDTSRDYLAKLLFWLVLPIDPFEFLV